MGAGGREGLPSCVGGVRTFIAGLRFSLGQQGAVPRLQIVLTASGEVLFLKRNRLCHGKSQRRGKLQLVEDWQESAVPRVSGPP